MHYFVFFFTFGYYVFEDKNKLKPNNQNKLNLAEYHPLFTDNLQVVNIELGAGCGNFGQIYYPECFITDMETKSKLDEICTNHFVTISCDARNIPCESNRFKNIIMCNPYGYGFKDRRDYTFLNELYRVSLNEANIIILTSGVNRFATPDKVKIRIKDYNLEHSTTRFMFDYQEIDSEKDYEGYNFFTTNRRKTFPKFKIALKCLKA